MTTTSAARTSGSGRRRGGARAAAPAEPGQLADQIAAAVAGCPGVAHLVAGPVGTYLPGRTVTGVAVRDRSVQVAVAARYGWPLVETAGQVRSAVQKIAPGRQVDVSIEDVVLDGELPPDDGPEQR